MRLILALLCVLFFMDVFAESRFRYYDLDLLCRNLSLLKHSIEELKAELDRRNVHCSAGGQVLPGKGPIPTEFVPDEGPFVRMVEQERYEPKELRERRLEILCGLKNTPNVQAELKRRHYTCVRMIEGRRGGPYRAEALASSADNPSPVDAPSKFDTDVLCKWHRTVTGHPNIAKELRRRDDFSNIDADLIAKRSIAIGMAEKALLCSWGPPTDLNRSVGSWGVHKQYVYSGTYVYTENGVITSWQD